MAGVLTHVAFFWFQTEGILGSGVVEPAPTRPGERQGEHPEPGVGLHPAGPDCPELSLLVDGPPGVLLPLHPPKELVPHRPQARVHALDGAGTLVIF